MVIGPTAGLPSSETHAGRVHYSTDASIDYSLRQVMADGKASGEVGLKVSKISSHLAAMGVWQFFLFGGSPDGSSSTDAQIQS